MGLLVKGVPQSWEQSKQNLSYVRNAGVRQFIATYNRAKHLTGDTLLWGDETEYGIFVLDPTTKQIRLSLRAEEIMNELNERERAESHPQHRMEGCNWVPEYGAWMVEATPDKPYTGFTNDLLRCERNMRLRRKRMLCVLTEHEIAPTVSVFPLLGAQGDDGSVPATAVGGSVTESQYIGDGIINPHPRFGTLSANIRARRGEKVNIRVPLFWDVNTPEFQGFDVTNCSPCAKSASQLWRYGQGDASRELYGDGFVVVGCSRDVLAMESEIETGDPVTLEHWLVQVECEGCRGLFYRSAPNVIVPDADWPKNGEMVIGIEVPDIPGWLRLQNGYYLPIQSDDGNIKFLHKMAKLPSSVSSSSLASPIRVQNSLSSLSSSSSSLKASGSVRSVPLNDTRKVTELVKPTTTANATATPTATATATPGKMHKRVRPAIHMDAMAFGMGCCCLQVTFQAQDIGESRFIYDQLAVMAPIMMALTASTPFLRGRIADTDCRWGIISECVDDRTPTERGCTTDDNQTAQPELAGKGQRRLYKPRYDSISTYICQGRTPELYGRKSSGGMSNRVLNMYNDLPVPIDEETFRLLRDSGVDPALSQHIAHLFVRDPLVIFDGAVTEVDDDTQTEHFESIQSTNWQSVRFKPPPPPLINPDGTEDTSLHIGWRTEFRSMEMQLTDFENAAFTAFVVLTTRVIIAFDLNLYIPLSRVDANMQRAHSRNAAANGKFFFRRHMAPLEEGDDGFGVRYTSMFSAASNGGMRRTQSGSQFNEVDTDGISERRKNAPFHMGANEEENSYEEMTMAEIMTGKGDYFPGLIPLIRAYLDYIKCDTFTLARVNQYMDLIEKRASGVLVTPATWMRKFVREHPGYKNDSVITEAIAYDLMVACKEIGEGTRHVPELLGDLTFDQITTEGAYDVKLDSKLVHDNCQLLDLLKRYSGRISSERSTNEKSFRRQSSSGAW